MSAKPFYIDLHNLPAHGVDVAGTLPATFLEIDPKDVIKPTSDVSYDLHIERDGDSLLLTGSLSASFELECGRCLGRFPYLLDLADYQSEAEVEANKSTMDLTDVIRDDILVALPSYPRCEDGNVEPRECPAHGRFELGQGQAPVDDEAAGPDAGVWDALDQLKN